jgi:membrane-bound ClpP family serine protease
MTADCRGSRKSRLRPAPKSFGRPAYVLALCGMLTLGGFLLSGSAPYATEAKSVVAIDVKGAIGVATSMHLCGVLGEARVKAAELVVVRLDTPGGILTSTREVIQCICVRTAAPPETWSASCPCAWRTGR